MQRTIDPKSLLLGLLAGFGVVALLGARADEPAAPTAGRYTISAYGEFNGSGVYILDTVTGELWHREPRVRANTDLTKLGSLEKPRVEAVPLVN